jgi:hypothetical protein
MIRVIFLCALICFCKTLPAQEQRVDVTGRAELSDDIDDSRRRALQDALIQITRQSAVTITTASEVDRGALVTDSFITRSRATVRRYDVGTAIIRDKQLTLPVTGWLQEIPERSTCPAQIRPPSHDRLLKIYIPADMDVTTTRQKLEDLIAYLMPAQIDILYANAGSGAVSLNTDTKNDYTLLTQDTAAFARSNRQVIHLHIYPVRQRVRFLPITRPGLRVKLEIETPDDGVAAHSSTAFALQTWRENVASFKMAQTCATPAGRVVGRHAQQAFVLTMGYKARPGTLIRARQLDDPALEAPVLGHVIAVQSGIAMVALSLASHNKFLPQLIDFID